MKNYLTSFYKKNLLTMILFSVIGSTAYAKTWYVKQGATGDGSSWTNASGDPQQMIEACSQDGGGEVWVARGLYYPRHYPNGGDGIARSVHFSLRNNVAVYGGFVGNETSVAQRTEYGYAEKNSSTFSGNLDLGGNNDATNIFYHPMGTFLDQTAILDGAVVANGYGTKGAGMYNEYSSPTIRNSSFATNYATYGGAIYNSFGSPQLTRCTFISNSVNTKGGAIYNNESALVINKCIFDGNDIEIASTAANATVYAHGGAMYNHKSTVNISNSIFKENVCNTRSEYSSQSSTTQKAYSYGGAIYNGGGDIKVINSLFYDNEASSYAKQFESSSSQSGLAYAYSYGGAVYCDSSSNFESINCTFSRNKSTAKSYSFSTSSYGGTSYSYAYAGAIYNANNDNIITNTIAYNNTASTGGSGYSGRHVNTSSDPNIKSGTITYSLDGVDPKFVDATNGDFRLQTTSTAIGTGNNSAVLGVDLNGDDSDGNTVLSDLLTDLDGNSRIHDSTVDMGCYEYGSSPISLTPVIAAISDQVVNENELLTFNVEATGGELTYALGAAAPAGTEINSETGAFSWTPTFSQANVYNFDIEVTNSNGTSTSPVQITVNNSPAPPTFTQVEDQIVIAGEALNLTVEAVDPEGALVQYSILGNTVPAATIGLLDGVFTWQTTPEDIGTYTFVFDFFDNVLHSQMTMTVYVITNDITALLSDTPEAQLGFKNVLVANGVENIIEENMSLYQEEFAQNIDFLASDASLYQSIIDAVNAGDATLIQSVRRGWNLISCPFANWSALTITGERVARPVYYYNVETQVYDMVNTTQQIRQGEGLWIFIDDVEVAEGEELPYFMSGQFRDDLQFSYVYGWNLIGTTTEGEKWSANNFLYSWDSSVGGYQNNTGEVMELGLGYWIFFMPPPGGPNN